MGPNRAQPRWKRASLFSLLVGLLIVSLMPFQAKAAEYWPTRGGDDGRIIEVSSLANSGKGTLREALTHSGPRKIVFKVAGEIVLSRPLLINEPYVTVAGETAQNPGVTILGDKIQIVTHNVILRHIRVRVGEVGKSKPENRDGISIEGGHKEPRTVTRILVDHCSIAWAIDEGLSIWGVGVHDVVVRNTIIAETLRDSVHPKGDHSMGLMVGPGVRNVLLERNLLANNVWRNPVIHGGASAVVLNNLIYNPGFGGLHLYPHKDSGATLVSAVGNALIAGPDTSRRLPAFAKGVNPGSRVYYRDNISVGTIAFDPSETLSDATAPSPFVAEPPTWFDALDVLDSRDVEKRVLKDVGAFPANRDTVDSRIIGEVVRRRGGVKDHPVDHRLVASKTRVSRPSHPGN